jgi:DNA-binding CsgD family transcriptional regulator
MSVNGFFVLEKLPMTNKSTYKELKQRVNDLQKEALERNRSEEALRESARRLQIAYDQSIIYARELKKEIQERNLTEERLRKRKAELKIKTRNLEEANIALKVLLKRRDEDKIDLEKKVLLNIQKLILPHLQELKASGLDDRQDAYLCVLESNLNDIVSPFSHELSSKYTNCTPAELQVAKLVKQGKTTKEIAKMLNSSTRAIKFHRDNLREKLGLKNRKLNLRSYLLSFTQRQV